MVSLLLKRQQWWSSNNIFSYREKSSWSLCERPLSCVQQHHLVRFRLSSGARGAKNPSACSASGSGRHRRRYALSRDGPAPCPLLPTALSRLRHTGARPAAHLTSPTLSTDAMQIASPRFPRALLADAALIGVGQIDGGTYSHNQVLFHEPSVANGSEEKLKVRVANVEARSETVFPIRLYFLTSHC